MIPFDVEVGAVGDAEMEAPGTATDTAPSALREALTDDHVLQLLAVTVEDTLAEVAGPRCRDFTASCLVGQPNGNGDRPC